MNEINEEPDDKNQSEQSRFLNIVREQLSTLQTPDEVEEYMYLIRDHMGEEGYDAFFDIRTSMRGMPNSAYRHSDEQREQLQIDINKRLNNDPERKYQTAREAWLGCIQRMESLYGQSPIASLETFRFVNGQFYEDFILSRQTEESEIE